MTTHPQKLILLWTLMVLCMMLHFNYNVSGIFYGIDVAAKDAKGVVPHSAAILRLLFNILPMLFAVVLLFYSGKAIRIFMLAISALYIVAHSFHLAGILNETPFDASQAMLLSFTVAICLVQTRVAYTWVRHT